MLTLLPSMFACFKPSLNAATRKEEGSGDPGLRNPTTTMLCCARAASGHAAAPPSSLMKLRRFMSDMGLPPARSDHQQPTDPIVRSAYRRVACKSSGQTRIVLIRYRKTPTLSSMACLGGASCMDAAQHDDKSISHRPQ